MVMLVEGETRGYSYFQCDQRRRGSPPTFGLPSDTIILAPRSAALLCPLWAVRRSRGSASGVISVLLNDLWSQ